MSAEPDQPPHRPDPGYFADPARVDLFAAPLVESLESFLRAVDAFTIPDTNGRLMHNEGSARVLWQRLCKVRDSYWMALIALYRKYGKPIDDKVPENVYLPIGTQGADPTLATAIDEVTSAFFFVEFDVGKSIPREALDRYYSAVRMLRLYLEETEAESRSKRESTAGRKERPNTLGEALDWSASEKAMASVLGVNGQRWLSKVKPLLGRPQWKAERCPSWYSVRDHIAAFRAAAPDGVFGEFPLEDRQLDWQALRRLKPPGSQPTWANRAEIRPE